MSVAPRNSSSIVSNENVALLLAGPLSARASAPALVERVGRRDRVTSFAELDARAWDAAARLAANGVGKGDGVLFFEHPSRELYAALIATFRLGAVALFVEPSSGRRTLDAACAMWPPKALVATGRAHLLRLVSPGVRRIPAKFVSSGWAPFAQSLAVRRPAQKDDRAVTQVHADAPALLTFTSGSTGQPKAAVRTHGILRAQLAALGAIAAREGERDLVSMPIVVLINLASGAETILPDADLRRPGAIDPEPVRKQIAAHSATRATVSPALLERLTEGEAGSLSALRTIVTGGGPVFPDIVARARRAAPLARIVSVYGSTEAEPIAHVRDDDVLADDMQAMQEGAGLLAGAVDECARIRIVPNTWGVPMRAMPARELDALALPSGNVGEIVVSGAHVVTGYLHGRGDEETKFRVDGVVWHRTGDLGSLDARGRLWLLGRASAAIQDSRGTLYPFALECSARMKRPGSRVAVVQSEGKRVLVVEAASLRESERAEWREALAWAHLDDVVSVERIPVDRRHNSKVDYPALMKLVAR